MGAIFKPRAELAAVTKLAAEAGGKLADINVWQIIAKIVPASVLSALVNESVLQVIFFSLLFGICLSYMKVSDNDRIRTITAATYQVFDCVSEVTMRIVRGIMQYAPIGVAVLIAE